MQKEELEAVVVAEVESRLSAMLRALSADDVLKEDGGSCQQAVAFAAACKRPSRSSWSGPSPP